MKPYNPNDNGRKGLALAIAWFTLKDYFVSVPFSRHGIYDLLVDKFDGKIKKIKVVTTNYKTPYGKFEANLQVSGGMAGYKITKFDSTLVDFIFIVCNFKEFYLIPSTEFSGTKKINPESYPTCRVDFI